MGKFIFGSFLPPDSIDYCKNLWLKFDFHCRLSGDRKTKLGDFRVKDSQCYISVNRTLPAQAFLITYIHEVAHVVVWRKGKKVRPHGPEWKNTFSELMQPVLTTPVFSEEVLIDLQLYFKNPSASVLSNTKLYRQLYLKEEATLLQDIQVGGEFEFRNFTYQKLVKRRTRSLCLRLTDKRKYLISEKAVVRDHLTD